MRNDLSLFDITGPILIGPSSSHTAGACRLANAARAIFNHRIESAKIVVYGSFAQTLFGHGTDKALVGGLLGMRPDDERLPQALALAKMDGLEYRFVRGSGVFSAANAVRFELDGEGLQMSVAGESIGGGSIIVSRIDQTDLHISLKYNTIVVDHIDKPGAVLSVSKILAENEINIASMNMYRQARHDRAYMIIEIDEELAEGVLQQLRALADMQVIFIHKLY